MRKRKKVKITCANCEREFEKDESEFKRNTSLGRKNYCSQTCSAKGNSKNFGDKIFDITKCSKKRTEFSPFSYHLRAAKRRSSAVDFDTPYLKEIWEKQEGICPYSKVKLVQPSIRLENDIRFTASLDRIDSSKDYIKGNIQFISLAMNYMKAQMSHEQTLELIMTIKGL